MQQVPFTIMDRLLSHVYPILLGGEAIDVEFEHREIDSITTNEILKMLEMKRLVYWNSRLNLELLLD